MDYLVAPLLGMMVKYEEIYCSFKLVRIQSFVISNDSDVCTGALVIKELAKAVAHVRVKQLLVVLHDEVVV